MKYIIISFKSRNNLLKFNKILKNQGMLTQIINTPRSTSISCSLSIKTDFRNLTNVINLVNQLHIDGLLGVYLINRIGMHEQTQRII